MKVHLNLVILQVAEKSWDEVCYAIVGSIRRENNYADSMVYIFITVLEQVSSRNFVWQNYDTFHEVFRKL